MRRPRAVAAACFALTACEDASPHLPDDVDWSGDIVDLVIAEDTRVCAGDLFTLDAHTRDVARLLRSAPDERVLVYWAPWQEVGDYCQRGAAGCALPDGAIVSSRHVAYHEVTHVLAGALGRSRPLWEEGLAEAMMPYPLFIGENHPVAMLRQLPLRDLSYQQAGHFVRWAWGEDSDGLLAAYAATRYQDDLEHALAAFETGWGESLYAVGDRYRDDAPEQAEALLPPEQEPLLPWSDGEWRHVLTFDCDALDTFNADPGLARSVYLDIPERARYEVNIAPAVGMLVPLPVTMEYRQYFDVSDTTLELDVGRYELSVTVDWAEQPIALQALVRRQLSSQPTTPD